MTEARNAFDDDARAQFAAHYPGQPTMIAHHMVGHPMLSIDALGALAARLDPSTIEYNRADLPTGIAPEATPDNGLSIADTIRSIRANNSWMVLKFIERDPAYAQLLADCLSAIAPAVEAASGPMLKMHGFVFLSSPDAVTPFHIDPEHNILLQIEGEKTMTIFPAGDTALVSDAQHEAFQRGAHRNLKWDEGFAAKGAAFNLTPGQAVHVPVKAPHHVKNGPLPSISLSITWRSRLSFAEAEVRGMNALLRQRGLTPMSPGIAPARDGVKRVAYRALGKVQRLIG